VGQGHTVSVVNPSVVNPSVTHAFARAVVARAQTDKTAAARIARYCRLRRPPTWPPPAEEVAVLQALVRRLETLQQMRQMEANRLGEAPASVCSSIEAMLSAFGARIAAVGQQVRDLIDSHPTRKGKSDLLTSIPGIGEATAALLLAALGGAAFSRAGQAAAFAGLVPRLKSSGTSVRSRPALCKMGRPGLREGLYFPAMVAPRFNPLVKALGQRMEAAGKNKTVILGAATRKLIHLASGVLKSGQPFDPR
jgi:transposase